jgi:maleylpyruvate isomerase
MPRLTDTWRQAIATTEAALRWAFVDRPTADIEGCRDAHARLATEVSKVSDSVARRASLLPDWTVGHVMTHLARNAESMVRRVEAAARDEVIEQYAGGVQGRASEIEAGAGRPADELIADVLVWSRRLDGVFESLANDCWSRSVRTAKGGEHPVVQLPFLRWWEVEVHLVDLGIGFGPTDWSQTLVDRALRRMIAGLADRADERALLAWTLGRGSPPTLGPWS